MRNRRPVVRSARKRQGTITLLFLGMYLPVFAVMLLFVSDGQAILVAHRDTSHVATGAALAGVVELDPDTAQLDPIGSEDAVDRFILEADTNGSVIVEIDDVVSEVINPTTLEVRVTYTNDQLLLVPLLANLFQTDEPIVQSTISRRAFVCIPGVSTTPGSSCQRPVLPQ